MSHIGSAIRAADNSIGWISSVVPAVGAVTIRINEVAITVDAAFPRDVISVVGPDVDTLSAAGGVFRNVAAIDALTAAADGDSLTGPELSDEFVRIAVLSAVRQCHLGDLDGIALLLDRAYAASLAGDDDAAATFYRLSSIGAELIADDLVRGGVAGTVVDAFGLCMRSAPADSIPSDIRSAIDQSLQELEGQSDNLWTYTFDESVAVADVAMGHFDGSLTSSITVDVLNDLNSVPPRLLVFNGPGLPDVFVTQAELGLAEVSAHLRDNVDETSSEVAELFAVAADSTSGNLVSFAPCQVSGRTVAARIPLQGREFMGLHFAIVGAGFNPVELHLDDLGVGVSKVDRYCRYAWTLHRVAGAALSGSGIGTSGAQIDQNRTHIAETLTSARASAQSALDAVRGLCDDYEDSRELQAYADAVRRLRDLIDSDPVFDGPTRPGFAELYALVSE